MDTIKIYTEEPEQELWRLILQFSYKATILRYFEEQRIEKYEEDDTLTNSIAGAIMQAHEYYKASKTASLQIEPLLLYYGTTNLFYALSVLLTGTIPKIENHGMNIDVDSGKNFIAETEVSFNHSSTGGIHCFAKNLGYGINLCDYHPWSLFDFLDSIAEIKDEFELCYRERRSFILPLDEIETPDGIVEKAYLGHDEEAQIIQMIDGFNDAYLEPQRVTSGNDDAYIVLYGKMNGKAIKDFSFSGQPYLQIGHKKKGTLITIPKELNMYVALYALGNLCRYHPDIWNPFVTQDSSGEKLLIEKLLYYSRRLLPNIVLNRIQKKQIVFVSNMYMPENRIQLVGQHEVQEIVSKEVHTQMRREKAQIVMHKNRS